ncbi:hypothetical protein ABT099_17030 [Streptomyces prasinus]|uniref:hypothetical protein n=1 Tax=Streptomyces prasinus TaxID=67345 RepID=UPI003332CE51
MNTPPVHLSAPRYVLGESEAHHTSIEDLPRKARAFGMPPKASLWGWGSVRRTAESLETPAVRSGRATLDAAGAAPSSVDCLVLCSTRLPGGPHTHARLVQDVMSRLDLDDAAFTLNRCTNLLTGLRTAQALIAGRHRGVLVVTTDRMTDASQRMETFALFSDGAASALVGAEAEGADGYEGESGEPQRSWGARGENQLHDAARP